MDRIRNRRQYILYRAPVATPRVGMPLPWRKRRQPVDFVARQFIRLAGLTYGRLQLHRADGPDDRHALAAVALADVLQHLVAPPATEVQVNVGDIGAGRVEEPLEEEIVRDGIYGGDAGAIGNQRIGDAAARADGNPLAPTVMDDIGHHEKERCVAVLADCRQLLFQALGDRRIGL